MVDPVDLARDPFWNEATVLRRALRRAEGYGAVLEVSRRHEAMLVARAVVMLGQSRQAAPIFVFLATWAAAVAVGAWSTGGTDLAVIWTIGAPVLAAHADRWRRSGREASRRLARRQRIARTECERLGSIADGRTDLGPRRDSVLTGVEQAPHVDR